MGSFESKKEKKDKGLKGERRRVNPSYKKKEKINCPWRTYQGRLGPKRKEKKAIRKGKQRKLWENKKPGPRTREEKHLQGTLTSWDSRGSTISNYLNESGEKKQFRRRRQDSSQTSGGGKAQYTQTKEMRDMEKGKGCWYHWFTRLLFQKDRESAGEKNEILGN